MEALGDLLNGVAAFLEAQDFSREVGNNPLFTEPVLGRRRKRSQRLSDFVYIVTCVCRHVVGPLPGGPVFARRFSANREICYLVNGKTWIRPPGVSPSDGPRVQQRRASW